MKPTTIWALVVMGVVTIGASTLLAITGHSIDPVIITLSTGASLITATGLLSHKQEQNATTMAKIATVVNGNTTKLIDAATASASLSPEELATAKALNAQLVPAAVPAPVPATITASEATLTPTVPQ